MWRVPSMWPASRSSGLAHVDHLQRRVLGEPLRDSLGIDIGLWGLIGGGHADQGSAAENTAVMCSSLGSDHMEAVSELYTIPQENLDFCAMIAQLAREKIAPRSAEIDESAEYPWDVRKLLGEQDILGLPFPVEYGGTGTGTLMLNMAVEEIAKVDAACSLILMIQDLGTLPIQLFGSEELKGRFLPRCATGRVVSGVCAVRARGGLGSLGNEDHSGARRR